MARYSITRQKERIVLVQGISFISALATFQAGPTGLNGYIFRDFNALAGRSWLFDNLVSLVIYNDLIKAAIIGACFFAVWYKKGTPEEVQRVRKILLVTLIASVFVLATTKTLSHVIFLPRPIVQSQKLYHLKGENLVEYQRVPVRVPLDEQSRQKYQKYLQGFLDSNDLGTLPSDHAGFFITLALGIWFASRRIGLLALAWTIFVILPSKIIAAQHTPLDVLAGAAIAVAWLTLSLYLARLRLPGRLLEKGAHLTLRYSAASSALIFIVVFEFSSTLNHVEPILSVLSAVGKRLLGRSA
jgi:undecaprenyl-diphosphatase